MKQTTRIEAQVIGGLREHEAGAKCADLCRKRDLSAGTSYAWKAQYCRMTVPEVKRLGAQEDQDAKRARFLAEQMPDMAVMKELLSKMVTPIVRREAVGLLKLLFGLSGRRGGPQDHPLPVAADN